MSIRIYFRAFSSCVTASTGCSLWRPEGPHISLANRTSWQLENGLDAQNFGLGFGVGLGGVGQVSTRLEVDGSLEWRS